MFRATCVATFSAVERYLTLRNVSCDLSRNGVSRQFARSIKQCNSPLWQMHMQPVIFFRENDPQLVYAELFYLVSSMTGRTDQFVSLTL